MIFKTRVLSAFLLLVIATSATQSHAWWVTDWLFSKPTAQAEVKTQSAAPQLLAIATAAFLLPTCFLGWKLYVATKKNNELAADIKKKVTKIKSQKKLLLRTDKAFESEFEQRSKLQNKVNALQHNKALALERKHWFDRWKQAQSFSKLKKQGQSEFEKTRVRQNQNFPVVGRVGHSATQLVLTPAVAEPEVQHIPQPLTPTLVAHQKHLKQLAAYEARSAQASALRDNNHARLYPNGSAAQPLATVRAQRRNGFDQRAISERAYH